MLGEIRRRSNARGRRARHSARAARRRPPARGKEAEEREGDGPDGLGTAIEAGGCASGDAGAMAAGGAPARGAELVERLTARLRAVAGELAAAAARADAEAAAREAAEAEAARQKVSRARRSRTLDEARRCWVRTHARQSEPRPRHDRTLTHTRAQARADALETQLGMATVLQAEAEDATRAVEAAEADAAAHKARAEELEERLHTVTLAAIGAAGRGMQSLHIGHTRSGSSYERLQREQLEGVEDIVEHRRPSQRHQQERFFEGERAPTTLARVACAQGRMERLRGLNNALRSGDAAVRAVM